MKKRILYFLLVAVLVFIAVLPVGAQKFYKDAILISNATLWQEGNSLYIDMLVDISNLKVAKDRTLTLTPVLVGAQNTLPLPEILINGKRREKAYLRAMALNKASGLQMPNGQTDVIAYSQVLPYQPWMANAILNLDENLCGCAGQQEESNQELITNEISTEEMRLSNLMPMVAYVQPAVEVVKARSEQYEAHLDFPVSKAVILTDFRNNHVELMNIRSLLEKIQNDKNLTVTGVSIEGFASPEGPLKLNEQLSKGRAEALKKYLSANEKIPASLYKVSFGGENWSGLVKALEASSMKEKDAFLGIIKNTADDVRRKQEMMRVGGGAPYREMLNELYPPLRKVDCQIDYTVVNFDVTQGRVVIQTQPKYLSLNEMYQVANSYPTGSNEFINVFDVAVRMYPNDDVANLNAAAVSLSKKDLKSARKYMEKANKQAAEYENNLGVLYCLEGDFQQAIPAFSKAAAKGNEAAKKNLKQLQDILNAKRK